MTTDNLLINEFLKSVKKTQMLWALQDTQSEGWVILDSINFEETDVMPLWSSAELAKSHCVDEWKGYTPVTISVADWLEFWVEDLAEDNVMIGVNWQGEEEYIELELAEFSQFVAEIETF